MTAAVRAPPAAAVLATAPSVHVVAGSAHEPIVAPTAVMEVVTGSAHEPIVATAAVMNVIARSATERVRVQVLSSAGAPSGIAPKERTLRS